MEITLSNICLNISKKLKRTIIIVDRLLMIIYLRKKKNSYDFNQKKENEDEDIYQLRYKPFISSIQNNRNFPGDFEIFAAAIILKKKIIVYYNTLLGYYFLNEYSGWNNVKDSIYLVYRNNLFIIYYQLLL